jgi:hypothetical protein
VSRPVDRPAGPGRRAVTVLPARVIPLDAEEERQAVAALAILLAAHLRDHPARPPASDPADRTGPP